MKKLLIFAHRAEASQFIKELRCKEVESPISDLWENENYYILLCGEGIEAAIAKTSACLGLFHQKIAQVINYGVAGSLDKEIKLNEVYSIRTAYAENTSLKMHFKSFTTYDKDAKYDLVSACQRVLDDNYSNQLSCFGDIVDRELWGISYASKLFKMPFYAYKLISDIAGNSTQCFDIKEQAKIFSQKMLDHFLNLEKINFECNPQSNQENIIETLNKDFFFSTTQERLFQNYCHNLSRKYKWNSIELLSSLNYQTIVLETKKPKDRTRKLLEKCNQLLNPFNYELEQKLSILFKSVPSHIKINTDPQKETSSIQIQCKIESETDRNNVLTAIQEIPLEALKNIFEATDV